MRKEGDVAEPKSEQAPLNEIPSLAAEKGSFAGMLAALTVLALVAIAAFWLIGTQRTAAAPGMTIAVETARPTGKAAPPPEASDVRQ